jgi:thioredoxin-related protein
MRTADNSAAPPGNRYVVDRRQRARPDNVLHRLEIVLHRRELWQVMNESLPRLNAPKGRRLRDWTPVLFAAALVALYYVITHTGSSLENWSTDYTAAITRAASTDRMVLVAFYSEGCPSCAAMKRGVLNSPAVREALAGFIPVKVNVACERKLANSLGVVGTPTYAVLDGRGKLLAWCDGYQPVDQFVRFLERASSPGPRGPSSMGPALPNGL